MGRCGNPLPEMVAHGGRQRSAFGDVGCGSRRLPFFGSGMGLYDGSLLGGGCDVHRGLTWMVSSAGCGVACRW
jgi:hypothetical protein